ncbi:ABC transporter substrate-binding protein [Occultella gossypii]|uniref:Extracellular solute-binding protein n=1 Tax=Occultella gossypii TaxID=2800820 RepID=A0ABS7SBZ7_9MICO|nr:extracellular solute-binding protein [Occultella gossypii]MBZ2197867.1 extracellular solute-binding protein [Occultella gossypii]
MKFRQARPLVIGATAAALLLAGCSGSSGGGSDDSVEITWWMLTPEESEVAAFDALIEEFESANEGVTINLETRATDQHKEALRTSVGTSGAPDIYFMWTGYGLGGEFVGLGASMDLTDAYAEYGWEERFDGATMGAITQYGQYDGVPWTSAGEFIYYHKDLFEQAGLEVPETYDAFVEVAETLSAQGVTPIEFGGTVNWHVMRFLDSLLETSCGADTMDTLLALEGDWGAEACVEEAFAELKTWGDNYFNEGYLGIDNLQSSQLFYTGDAAMAYEGDWFNAQMVDNGVDVEEIGIFAFPTDTGRLYGLSEALYVSPNTEHPDEVMAFLDFVSSEESQSEIAGVFGARSVNVNVPVSADNPLNAVVAELAGEATGSYVNNDQALPLDVTTEYWRVQNSVLTGDIDPADAGSTLQDFIDAR